MRTTIYLATARGLAVVTGSDGTWRGEVRLPGRQVQCVAVDSKQPKNVYCGTFGDGIFRSCDGGITWRSCDGVVQSKVMALAISPASHAENPGLIYAGTEPSALFRSEENGQNWHELPTLLNLPSAGEWSFPPRPETHHVRFILPDPHTAGRMYVAIEAGALLRSEDGGLTWRDRISGGPLDTHTLAVHAGAPGRLYSAAGDGYFESLDGGDRWRRIDDGLQYRYGWSVAVSSADPDTILLTASNGAREAHVKESVNSFVYRRTRGQPWSEIRKGLSDLQARRIAVVTASAIEPDVFYLSAEGDVYRSGDGGESWQQLIVEWTGDHRPEHALAIALAG